MKQKSKHNILVKLENGGAIIANPLYESADWLSQEEVTQYENNQLEQSNWVASPYVVSPKEEESIFQEKYLQFVDDRDEDEIQLFFVPTYACNFGCSYCYQEEYSNTVKPVSNEVIDSFFSYILTEFKGRKKYITLFGGEPLLPNDAHFNAIKYFLAKAKIHSIEVAIVTNGFHINRYLEILKDAPIREVQVTLDGLKQAHDERRPLKGGGSTFAPIVDGITNLLNETIPINLRMVIDGDNILELSKLAQFAISKGWTKHPYFKTQLGRNYELHTCQKNNTSLYSRIELYSQISTLIKEHPHILEFHKPSFHFVKSLAENKQMPAPIFDACPGCKTEWAFDYTGNIYSCTATVGKKGESLGTFYPTVTQNEDVIEQWQDRDVLAINDCQSCESRLICGGGCGSIAKNKHGYLHAPDCRPVKEISAIGLGVYFDKNGDVKNR